MNYQVSTLGEGGYSATFSAIDDVLKNTDETIYAAYPETDITDGIATLPYTDNWIGERPMPFGYAVSKVTDGKVNLSFNHLYAYLKLTLNAETVAGSDVKEITDIYISNPSGTPVALAAGRFDFESQSIIQEKGVNYMYYTLQESFTATGDAEKSIYIPILPQSTGETLTLSVLHQQGNACDTLYSVTKETPRNGFIAGHAYTYSPQSSFIKEGNTITLTEAGTLSDAISEKDKYTLTSLKIIGPLNGDDIRFFIEMAGRDINEKATKGKLTDLDISEATIVEGGDMYFKDYDGNEHYTSYNEIGDCMFWRCFLKSIILPNNVTTIGNYAFYDCSSLASITIPDGVTSIGEEAFLNCIAMASIKIPNKVTTIGRSAFSFCTGLTSVAMGNGVTSIGEKAFIGCESLSSITIPESVTSIEGYAFLGCEALTEVTCNATTPPSLGSSVFIASPATLYVPSGTYAAYMASDWASYFTTIDDGEDHGSYENGVATVVTAGTLSTLIPEEEKYTITKLKVVGPLNGSDIRYIREMAGRDVNGNETEGKLVDLDISEATIVEGGDMYYNDTANLGECYTENDVLGNFMFSYTKLQRILPPVNITSIGNSAFRFCESLTDVVIPETVTSLEDYAFSFCIKLTDINLPEAITSIGFEAFSACNLLNNIIIPEAVTTIGDYAFSDCHTFTKIIIPDNVTSIGAYTFQRCYNMTEVAIGNGVMSIGNSAFRGCSALHTIVIPDGVTLIENSAFEECSELSNVEFSDGLVSIGNSAFKNCAVESITLPNSLTSIGNDAFGYCETLSEVTCNATTPPSLGSSVFIASPATLYVPSGTYTAYMASDWAQYFSTIDDGEDHGSYENGVATVVAAGTLSSLIPEDEKYSIITLKVVGPLNGDDIRFIREMAGRDVNGNETEGRLVDLDLSEASIVEGGGEYLDSNGLGYNYTSNNEVGRSMFLQTIIKSITLPQNITSIDTGAFESCSFLTSIDIPNSVTEIGVLSFYRCTLLENVEFSTQSSLSSIGAGAFSECYSLSSIDIPISVSSIGERAFQGCIGIKDVKINSETSFASIGVQAFWGCSSLISVTIGNGVTSIGAQAFYECDQIKNVVISSQSSLASIGEHAFSECSSLTSIIIPDGVTSIGDCAFQGCTLLENVLISSQSSLVSIGNSAFAHCSSLTSINIPDGVTSIGSQTFYNCTLLEIVEISSQSALTSIASSSFAYCSSLASIYIPDGVTSIGEGTFIGCTLLEDVTISSQSALTSIDVNAFRFCSSLISIEIPYGVTSIGNNAFSDCSSLSEVTCNATTPPALGPTFLVFDGIASPATLYVPISCSTAYSESDWAQYFTTIEEK